MTAIVPYPLFIRHSAEPSYIKKLECPVLIAEMKHIIIVKMNRAIFPYYAVPKVRLQWTIPKTDSLKQLNANDLQLITAVINKDLKDDMKAELFNPSEENCLSQDVLKETRAVTLKQATSMCSRHIIECIQAEFGDSTENDFFAIFENVVLPSNPFEEKSVQKFYKSNLYEKTSITCGDDVLRYTIPGRLIAVAYVEDKKPIGLGIMHFRYASPSYFPCFACGNVDIHTGCLRHDSCRRKSVPCANDEGDPRLIICSQCVLLWRNQMYLKHPNHKLDPAMLSRLSFLFSGTPFGPEHLHEQWMRIFGNSFSFLEWKANQTLLKSRASSSTLRKYTVIASACAPSHVFSKVTSVDLFCYESSPTSTTNSISIEDADTSMKNDFEENDDNDIPPSPAYLDAVIVGADPMFGGQFYEDTLLDSGEEYKIA
jgi:hypothetical protein